MFKYITEIPAFKKHDNSFPSFPNYPLYSKLYLIISSVFQESKHKLENKKQGYLYYTIALYGKWTLVGE